MKVTAAFAMRVAEGGALLPPSASHLSVMMPVLPPDLERRNDARVVGRPQARSCAVARVFTHEIDISDLNSATEEGEVDPLN